MTGRGRERWSLPLADRDDCPRYTGSFDDAADVLPDAKKGWWQPHQTQSLDSRFGVLVTRPYSAPGWATGAATRNRASVSAGTIAPLSRLCSPLSPV